MPRRSSSLPTSCHGSVSGEALAVELAEELELLEPCGAGNPSVNLLVPAATCEDPRPIGEGRHVRFSLHAGGARARAVCFGAPRLPVESGVPADVTVRLGLNEWKGTVEPRVVLRSARPCDPAPIEVLGEPHDHVTAAIAELDAPLAGERPAVEGLLQPSLLGGEPAAVGELVPLRPRAVADRRGAGIAGVIASLVASGDPVLVVCADVPTRLRGLRERLGGFALCSHAALAREPSLAERFPHVVVLDPPEVAPLGAGRVHLAWGEDEIAFARRVLEHEAALRDGAATLYRALRAGEALRDALRAAGSPQRAGRLLRVLAEVGLVVVDRASRSAHVPPAQRTDLAHSVAFRSYTRQYEEGLRSLGESTARAA
jgi:single-stranded-DNA-specific exonuclease